MISGRNMRLPCAGSGGIKIFKIGVPNRDTPIYKSGSKVDEKPNNALFFGRLASPYGQTGRMYMPWNRSL